MIASLRHGLPVILGRTGYQPPHYLMVQAAAARLPDRDRLRALRTATGLRWILLRPTEQWPAGRRWFRAALLQSPDLERMTLRDGYDLLRVLVEPYDVDWYEAMDLASRLSMDGTQLMNQPVNNWRLPTVDEAVRSLTRGGENAGGEWDPESKRPSYKIQPDKESPLWRVCRREFC